MENGYTIAFFILILITIIGIFILYEGGILKRRVTVTIIEHLPPWIFKQGKKEDYSKNCGLKTHEEPHDEITTKDEDKGECNIEVSHNEEETEYNEETSITEELVDSDESLNVKEKNQEHKPKFITNSLSMLKDYELLMDKLNNDKAVSLKEEHDEKEVCIDKEENNPEDLKSVSEVKDKVKESSEVNENGQGKRGQIVYWTASGKTYHLRKDCRTLARSKVIHSGTIAESCKNSACSKCKN